MAEILAILPTHGLIILTKFDEDRTKIADFLLVAYLKASVIFYGPVSIFQLSFFQVIARIFFIVNRSWSGFITLSELRRSNLLTTLRLLQEEDDVNQITDFFSYEHFYVIYCKFWELDKDHDLFIDREDLARHNDHGK